MTAPSIATSGDPRGVWRVGYGPDPWAWVPWGYAGDDGASQEAVAAAKAMVEGGFLG